jgi:hypothetical protein
MTTIIPFKFGNYSAIARIVCSFFMTNAKLSLVMSPLKAKAAA